MRLTLITTVLAILCARGACESTPHTEDRVPWHPVSVSVVYGEVKSVARLGRWHVRLTLNVKRTLSGAYDVAAKPIVRPDVAFGPVVFGPHSGPIREHPKASTRVVAVLCRHEYPFPLDPSGHYFIPYGGENDILGTAGFVEVSGPDDAKVGELITRIAVARKARKEQPEMQFPRSVVERARTLQRERVPKMLEAAHDLLASVEQPEPKPPDEHRLTQFRGELLRALQIVAASEAHASRTDDAKVRAIQLLGSWRDTDASYLLAREVEFTTVLLRHEVPSHLLGCYPAAQSLVEIGSPALKVIFDQRMAEPVTDRELRIFAWVIYLIDGRDLGLARLELKVSELSRSYPRTRLENISRLLETYKTIDFKDQSQWPRPARNPPGKAKQGAK